MPLPVGKVEVAFGTEPLTVPGAWTDVTAYVRQVQGDRGRDHELSQSRAGECVIRLRNTDRRFDPLYTSSPYYPNVLPMRQVRVTATHNSVTYPLFYGYVEDWSQTWPGRPVSGVGDAECVLHAVDGFKLLSLYQLRDTYGAQVMADGPVLYYKFGEPVGGADIRVVKAEVGEDGGIGSNGVFGVAGPLLGGSTALDCPVTPNLFIGGPSGDMMNTTVEFWLKPDSFPGGGIWTILAADASGGAPRGQFDIYGASGTGVMGYDFTSGGTDYFTTDASWLLTVSVWNHVVFVHNGPAVECYINGVKKVTVATVAGCDVGGNDALTLCPSWMGSNAMDAKIAHLAVYNKPLMATRVAAHYAASYGDVGGGDAGAQTTTLLDMMGWPGGLRSIDTGAFQMQSFDPVGPALEHMLAAGEDSENGIVQMSADGKVTFHSRTSLLASTGSHGASQATFGDSGSELPYEGVEFRYDDQNLWTRAIVSRDDGAPQLATDAAALAAYGPRTLDRSAPRLSSDDDAQLLATFLLDQFRAPKVRPTSVHLKLGNDNTMNAAVLGRETHHDRVTVVRRPQGGGSAISFEAHVEGISFDITPGHSWEFDFALIPEPAVRFIFDECMAAPGTLDGGVTSTVSGTAAAVTLYTTTAFTGHTGVLELNTGTTTTGRAGLLGTADAVQLGALEVLYQGMVAPSALSDGTNTFTVRAGLGDSVSAESVDFVGFRYTHSVNGGRWQGVCRSNSTETTVDTGVTVAAGIWSKLGFTVNLAGTSVQFYVNDVAVGAPITTNIPTGSSRKLTYLPGFILKSAGTTNRSLFVDRFGYVLAP